jgi:hypothetical protein
MEMEKREGKLKNKSDAKLFVAKNLLVFAETKREQQSDRNFAIFQTHCKTIFNDFLKSFLRLF